MMSYKSKRTTRSVTESEIYAFADAFDCAYPLKYDLERIFKKHIPV